MKRLTFDMRRSSPFPHGAIGLFATSLFVLSIAIFCLAYREADLNYELLGVCLLFVSNCLLACLNLRDNLLYLALHGGIALFLLTRPVVSLFDGKKFTWFLKTFESTEFALTSIFISLLFLALGSAFYRLIQNSNRSESRYRRSLSLRASALRIPRSAERMVQGISQRESVRYIRIASLICFFVCLAGSLAVGFIRLQYMSGLPYEKFYLINQDEYVPWVLSTLDTMLPFMLCSFLATMPKRKSSTACILLYIATTLPMLIIGSRSEFVIGFLFLVFYYVLRHFGSRDEVWISKFMIVVAVALGIGGILLMGFWNYLRDGSVWRITSGPFVMFLDALYKQGVSFTVLGHGFDVNAQIQNLGFKFYSMGDLSSTITQGFIGQTFLGCENLGSTNSVKLALDGYSYSHAMSYFAHWNYLGGEGYGSSYILELFADFGYGGIAIGSFIIAICLRALSRSIGRNWFWCLVALQAFSSVFHMARGYAIEFISFIWSTRFLLAVCMVLVLAAILRFASEYRNNGSLSRKTSTSLQTVSEEEEGLTCLL